jgi:hypothetical protein
MNREHYWGNINNKTKQKKVAGVDVFSTGLLLG